MMICEPIVSEPRDVSICRRMFSDGFKIKETPETSVKKASRVRRSRIMAMAKSASPELGDSPYSENQNLDCTAICSPKNENSTPQKRVYRAMKLRFPLEECDPNSQDSGYGDCSEEKSRQSKRRSFHFAEPRNVAPRRLSLDSRSPASSPQPKCLFRSLSSGYESTDDGMSELLDMESLGEEVPQNLASLITGNLVDLEERPMDVDSAATTPEAPACKRPCLGLRGIPERGGLQASLSLGAASRARSCLFRSPNGQSSVGRLGFKRPEPPGRLSPLLMKRSRKCAGRKLATVAASPASPASPPPQLLQRSHSETEAQAHIMSALNRSTTDADLTGDFSKPCILPLADGRHDDLKSISSETLSRLIRGDFADSISDFTIVDCRYPYEYEAGHIEGALNLYTKDMIEQRLLEPLQFAPVAIEPDCKKRSILVFHCEFSWERGPNLSRFLRNLDRQKNKEHYPALHYPEIYLLHGGYKEFFGLKKELCKPQGYRPMRHPDHEEDLRQFRTKSKTWQGEKTTRTNVVTARANLNRLCF